MWYAVAVVALVVLVATYVTWTAARVDRLHARATAAHATLDAHLVRRAVAASALAEAGQLPTLMFAARIALDAHPDDREAAENDLTRHVREVVRDVAENAEIARYADDDTLEPVVAASRRVALARQVHNDVVRDALALRRSKPVRLFRLARKHPNPAYFDIDDPTIVTAAKDGPRPSDWPSEPATRPA